jgi:hypothetical protein
MPIGVETHHKLMAVGFYQHKAIASMAWSVISMKKPNYMLLIGAMRLYLCLLLPL